MKNLKAQIVKEFKKGLNKKSKWYAQDLATYEANISRENNEPRLKMMLSNMICMNGNSPSFNKEVKQIKKELEQGGMYDVKKMKHKNAID